MQTILTLLGLFIAVCYGPVVIRLAFVLLTGAYHALAFAVRLVLTIVLAAGWLAGRALSAARRCRLLRLRPLRPGQ